MPSLVFIIGTIICLYTSVIFKKVATDMCHYEWRSQNIFFAMEAIIIIVGILFEFSLIRLTVTLTVFFA